MIRNGNYYYLDFASIIPNLIEVFTEYYGQQHRQTITDRLNNIFYHGGIDSEEVIDYYNQSLGKYKLEILKEYQRLTGERLTSEQKDLLLNDSGESKVLEAMMIGLKRNKIDISRETYQIERDRIKIAKAFGIGNLDDMSIYYQIRKIASNLQKSISNIEYNHPCDVYKDVRNYITASKMAIKAYLQAIDNNGIMDISSKDMSIIHSSDFGVIDYANLDSDGLLFTGDITNRGLYQAFLPENYSKIKDRDPYIRCGECLDIIEWIYRHQGENIDCIKIRPQEIYDYRSALERKSITQEDAYRIIDEYKYQMEHYRHLTLDQSTANTIEKLRKQYSNNIKHSATMGIYNGSNKYFCMPGYINNKSNRPYVSIHFDESQTLPLDELFQYLIHEINHAICLGNAIKGKNGKLNTRFGLFTMKDIKMAGSGYEKFFTYKKDNRMELLEENINERMSIELAQLYLSKYPNPFDANDITYSDVRMSNCMYRNCNFMTEGFYQAYKEELKEYRINPDYNLFYVDRSNSSDLSLILGLIKDEISRKINEDKFKSTGKLDYLSVLRLASYVHLFQSNLLPNIMYHIRDVDNIVEDVDIFASEYSQEIHKYLDIAREITIDMLRDSGKLEELEEYKDM